MVRLILLLIFIQFADLSIAQKSAQQLKKMEWVLGTWDRTNTKPGRSAFERWDLKEESEWTGRGVNLRGADTLLVEKLRIVKEKDQLFYVADVPENKQPVYFEITSVTTSSFVCENPNHDFPKRIEYHLQGDGRLLAQISGGDKKVDYWFERRK